MSKRHKTVQFNPAEWLADTARMPRLVRSVFFDLYVYTLERVATVPASEVYLMVSDLPEGQGDAIIENLVAGGHLERMADGSVFSGKAMIAAQSAYVLWQQRSRGGRRGAPEPEEEIEAPAEPPKEAIEPEPQAAPPTDEEMMKAIHHANGVVEITTAWNRLAAARGLKQIVRMTQERVGRLNARIAEHGAEAIIAAIERMADNEMVLATKPTFDSILNPATCAKMIERPVENSED